MIRFSRTEIPTNHVQATSISCIINTETKLTNSPKIREDVVNDCFDLERINKLSNPPYVNEAILRPSTTTAVSPSSKISAIKISRQAQIPLIIMDLKRLAFVFIQS